MTDDELIEIILALKDGLKKDSNNFTSLSRDFYRYLNKFIKNQNLYRRNSATPSANKKINKKEHFNDEKIKDLTFDSCQRCPRCGKFPAQFDGFDAKPKPCLNCESKDLEKDFIF